MCVAPLSLGLRIARGGDDTGAREAVRGSARQGLTGAWMVVLRELMV
jgi:hypothetical protein